MHLSADAFVFTHAVNGHRPWPPGYATRQFIAARRAALLQLVAELPAAVLGDLLNLTPSTAVGWVNNAGGDWSRYAAALINQAITNPPEQHTPDPHQREHPPVR